MALKRWKRKVRKERRKKSRTLKALVSAALIGLGGLAGHKIAKPNPIDNLAFIMVYADDLDGKNYKLPISSKEYLKYLKMPHSKKSLADYLDFVTYENETIRSYAKFMTNNLTSPEAKAQRLLDFVHLHMYDLTIEKNRDYIRYPLETMVEHVGDCEDLSILGASLMKAVGLDVALVIFPSTSKAINNAHAGLAIAGDFSGHHFQIGDKKYYYAEATNSEWPDQRKERKIGEMADMLQTREALVYIVK